MLSGYADQHVKSGIVEGLRRRGLDVTTTQDRHTEEFADKELLAAATSESRLLLTNDTDFLRIHSEWLALQKDHAGIIFWAQSLPIGEAIRRILKYAMHTEPSAAKNTVKFL